MNWKNPEASLISDTEKGRIPEHCTLYDLILIVTIQDFTLIDSKVTTIWHYPTI